MLDRVLALKAFAATISQIASRLMIYTLIIAMVIYSPNSLRTDQIFQAFNLLLAIRSALFGKFYNMIEDASETVTTLRRLKVIDTLEKIWLVKHIWVLIKKNKLERLNS